MASDQQDRAMEAYLEQLEENEALGWRLYDEALEAWTPPDDVPVDRGTVDPAGCLRGWQDAAVAWRREAPRHLRRKLNLVVQTIEEYLQTSAELQAVIASEQAGSTARALAGADAMRVELRGELGRDPSDEELIARILEAAEEEQQR